MILSYFFNANQTLYKCYSNYFSKCMIFTSILQLDTPRILPPKTCHVYICGGSTPGCLEENLIKLFYSPPPPRVISSFLSKEWMVHVKHSESNTYITHFSSFEITILIKSTHFPPTTLFQW